MNTFEHKISLLKNINWSFPDKGILNIGDKKPFDSRRFHWYPATYIPEIPYSLIEILSQEGDTVYDPFSGAGTTFFQALILNRNAIASDSNTIIIDYINSLSEIMVGSVDLNALTKQLLEKTSKFQEEKDYSGNITKDKYLLLSPWFDKYSFNELLFLYGLYNNSNGKIKTLIFILISGIVKTVCSQDRGWGYIADNVKPKEKEYTYRKVIETFNKKASSLIAELNKIDFSDKPNFKTKYIVFKHNIMDDIPIEAHSIDLIVTSPPYPNMIDYAKSQRLLYYFFDNDMKEDLNKEIGARAFRNRKNAINDYFEQMKIAFTNIKKVLKKNGTMCLVLPLYEDNKKNIRRKETIDLLLEWLGNDDFKIEHTIKRTISLTRKNQNTSLSSLNQEQIVILRRAI